MNVIIIGCGRVGSQLAIMLSNNNHDVCVIDVDQTAFASLGYDFNGRAIKGLGFDETILQEADIESCDVFAAVTNQDNANLMAAEVARKIYQVPHVITRLYNPDRENTYLQLGLDYTCGTTLVAEEMFAKIQSGHGNHIDTFGDFEVLRFALKLEDRPQIKVGDIERTKEVRIAAYEHNGNSFIPTSETALHNGDIVIATVGIDYLPEFANRFMKQ